MKRSPRDIDRLHQKVNEKFDAIEKRESAIDELRNELQQKERKLSRMEDSIASR